MTGPQPGALATAQALTEGMENLGRKVAGLTGAVRRNRLLTWVVLGLIVLVIAAVIVAVIGFVTALHADGRASAAQARAAVNQARLEAAHASNVSACQQGNVTRGQEVQLWQTLYADSLRSGPPLTAAQKTADEQFLAYVGRTFAPRDCSAIYRDPG